MEIEIHKVGRYYFLNKKQNFDYIQSHRLNTHNEEKQVWTFPKSPRHPLLLSCPIVAVCYAESNLQAHIRGIINMS